MNIFSCIKCPFHKWDYKYDYVFCKAPNGPAVDLSNLSYEDRIAISNLVAVTRHPECPFNTGDTLTLKFCQ